jgi:hypothetical protein
MFIRSPTREVTGRIVYLGGNNIAVNLVVGVALPLGCVIIPAIAGSVVGVLMVVSKQPSFVRSNPLADAGSLHS